MRFLLPLFVCFAAGTSVLQAQVYGVWDVDCYFRLPPRFSAPFNHGVIQGGREFLTEWQAENSAGPRTSLEWYHPSPDRNPVSTDGQARWYDAGVKNHCFVERTPYWTTYHADPVEYRGSVRACGGASGGGGGGPWLSPDLVAYEYDPFTPGGESEASCSEPGGTGGGAGATCTEEYIVVEISYDDGATWEVIWEGWTQFCG